MGYQNLKSTKRMLALLSCAGFLAIFATACGSNSGGGGSTAVPLPISATGLGGYGVPSCASCPTSEAFIANGVADAGSAAEMGLYFYGNAQTIQQSQASQSQYGYTQPYYGPAAATGYLYLAQGLPSCNIPAGRYTLTTTTPGVFGADGAGRSVDNLVMTASGAPMAIGISGYTVPAAPPAVGMDGNTYPYRFTATTLLIQRTDTGAACNLSLQLQ